MSEHNEIGKIGEKIAREFLMKHGFLILDTNFRTKFGEIDIIAEKDRIVHFVEVKSIKVRDLSNLNLNSFSPEDNLTHSKWRKFVKTAEFHNLIKNNNQKSIIDLVCVYIDLEKRGGKVNIFEDIVKD